MGSVVSLYLAMIMLFTGVAGLLPERASLRGSADFDVSGKKGDVDFVLDSERARVDYLTGDEAKTYYVDRDGFMLFSHLYPGINQYSIRSVLEIMARYGNESIQGADYLPSGLLSDLSTLQPHLAKLWKSVLAHPEWFNLTVSDDGQNYESLAVDKAYMLLWCRYARMTLDGETLRAAACELVRDCLSDPALLGDIDGLAVWSVINGYRSRYSYSANPITEVVSALSYAYQELNRNDWAFHLTLDLERQDDMLCLTVQNIMDGATQGSFMFRASTDDTSGNGLKLEYQYEELYNAHYPSLQTGALFVRDGNARLTYYDSYSNASLYASAEWNKHGYCARFSNGIRSNGIRQFLNEYILKGYFSYDDGFRHDAMLTRANGFDSIATLCQTIKPDSDGGFTHDLSVVDGNEAGSGFQLHHQHSKASFADNDLTLRILQDGRDAFGAELHQDQTAMEAQNITLALRQYGQPLIDLSFNSAVNVLAGGYTALVDAEANIPDVGQYAARYASTYTPGNQGGGGKTEAALRLLNNNNEFFHAQASTEEQAFGTALSATCTVMGMELLNANVKVNHSFFSREPASVEAELAIMGDHFVLTSRCEGAPSLTSDGLSRFELSARERGAEAFGLLLTREPFVKGDGSTWLLKLSEKGTALADVQLSHAPAKEPDASDWSLRVYDANRAELFALALWQQLTIREDNTLSHALHAEFTDAYNDSVQLESMLTMPR